MINIESGNLTTLWVFLILSALWLLIGLIRTICLVRKRYEIDPGRLVFAFSLYLILSVWCLRFAVGYYDTLVFLASETAGYSLNPAEQFMDSLVHALQSFSMDEDYTKYIVSGKALIANLVNGNDTLTLVYGIYASALNILTPIAGGAILFEVLASIFPRIQYFFRPCWRKMYVFSELNDSSLALAKSLRTEAREKHIKKPVLVFTDVYEDRKNEKNTERLNAAKALWAICLKDDLMNIKVSKRSKVVYFLIDEDETSNLLTISEMLSSDSKLPINKNVEIYLFNQNDIAGSIVRTVEKRCPEGKMPLIRVVRGYTNMVYTLLSEVPLYEPLINADGTCRSPEGGLNLTIVGSGEIGTEVFLSAYWCGQILDCPLTIHIISQESEKAFINKITMINPDILETTKKDSSILLVYPGKRVYNPVYFSYVYHEADATTMGLYAALINQSAESHIKSPIDSDYFVVAIGSDEKNLSVAENIRRYIDKARLIDKNTSKAVVAYVLYDKHLCDALNLSNKNNIQNVYMHAFGSMESIYSYRNVVMKNFETRAYINCKVCDSPEQKYTDEDMKKFIKDEYTWWSDITRTIHIKYKMFSTGFIRHSVFSNLSEEAIVKLEDDEKLSYREFLEDPRNSETVCKLAWLEHRRWNAFLRSKGFTCPTTSQYAAYRYNGIYQHKNLSLKLHPCIVECDQLPMKDIPWDEKQFPPNKNLDMLDMASLERYICDPTRRIAHTNDTTGQHAHDAETKREENDFKCWDRPLDKQTGDIV